MTPRDRAFGRLIAVTTLRHLGQIQYLLARFIEKPLPEQVGRFKSIMATTVAQLIFLNTPPHAALSQAVDIVRLDHNARRFDKLANAVLRRISEQGKDIVASLDGVRLDIPDWLWQRWAYHYGEVEARAIAAASLAEPALDLTVKSDPGGWAEQLSGVALPSGAVRVREAGRVDELPGFDDGEWWVQDAAAALPARMLGDVKDLKVADLCAAPGGKTAQLALGGADVVAVDASAKRHERLQGNMARLGLGASYVKADAAEWSRLPANAAAFDAVLVDAPCSATGTIRRHPDLLRNKAETEVMRLATRQSDLIAAAASLVKSGGLMVYATCSLEPEEGEGIVTKFLAANDTFSLEPITATDLGVPEALVTPSGMLRTKPNLSLGPDPVMVGMDGFFAARLRRKT
jgi:16S rRNA (cytosine967-C5)-methyltransferase